MEEKVCSSKIPFWCKCAGAYIFFFICVVIIFIYWGIRNFLPESDFMNNIIYEIPEHKMRLSWWPVSHFLFFLLLGICFPHCDVLIISAGILWELFELIFGYFVNDGMDNPNKDVQYYRYWGASGYDIVLNIMGFYTGKAFITLWDQYTAPYRQPNENKDMPQQK